MKAAWPTMRLKFVAKVNPGASAAWPTDPETPVTFLPMESISARGGVDSSSKRPLREVRTGYTYFERSDVVIAKITPCFENGKGAWLNALDTPFGFGTTELIVLRPTARIDGRFLYWVTQGRDFRARGERSMTGSAGQQRVSNEFVANFPIAVPPLPVQQQLCDVLESRLAEIDRFAAAKLRTIELFREQKRSIIDRAVTGGVNASAPTRGSKLNRLGDVPSHWEEHRAKYYFDEVDERSTSGHEELLSVSHITGVTPRREKNITMFMAESYEGSKLCRPGDLVINIMWAWMGACGVSEYIGIVSPSYGVYRPKSGMFVGRYLDFLSRCAPYVAEYNCRSTGITSSRLRMYTDAFFSMPIVRPPIEEQQLILDVIADEAVSIDRAITVAERELDLLEEFRSALIADAVMGKLDIGSSKGKVEVSVA